jgi:hypothetical protein
MAGVKRWWTGNQGPRGDAIPQHVFADRDRREEAARDALTPNMIHLGDPPPGRSALENRIAKGSSGS